MVKHAVRLITSPGIWISCLLALVLVTLFQGWSVLEISSERFLYLTIAWIPLSVAIFILGWIFVEDWPHPTFGKEAQRTWRDTEENDHGK